MDIPLLRWILPSEALMSSSEIFSKLKALTLTNIDFALIGALSKLSSSATFDGETKELVYVSFKGETPQGKTFSLTADIPSIEDISTPQELKRFQSMVLLYMYFQLRETPKLSQVDSTVLTQMQGTIKKVEKLLLQPA